MLLTQPTRSRQSRQGLGAIGAERLSSFGDDAKILAHLPQHLGAMGR